MKTVAIASQKGGTGKTTTAVHLATAAALAGYHAESASFVPIRPGGMGRTTAFCNRIHPAQR